MKFVTKLVVATITIAATIVGSIWTGFETLDGRMDKKVQEGKKEVITLITVLKDERNLKIQAVDDKVVTEISGLKTQIASIDNKLNILIGRTQREVTWDTEKDNSEITSTMKESTLFLKNTAEPTNQRQFTSPMSPI